MFLKAEYLAVKNLEIISAPQLLSGALSGTISGAISPGGPSEMRVLVRSRAGTALLGRLLAQNVRGGFSVGLSGEMGAGKTEFVRGIVKALGSRDLVTSPTYILEAEYGLELPAAAEGNEGDRDRKLQPPLGDITQVAVDRGINLISHWDLFRLAPPSVDPCSNISREIPPDLVARLQAPDVLTIVEAAYVVENVARNKTQATATETLHLMMLEDIYIYVLYKYFEHYRQVHAHNYCHSHMKTPLRCRGVFMILYLLFVTLWDKGRLERALQAGRIKKGRCEPKSAAA